MMAKGKKLWHISGCYLVLVNRATIQYLMAAMAEHPMGAELIVARDLNVDLESTGGRVQDKEIAVAVVTAGLEGISAHSLP